MARRAVQWSVSEARRPDRDRGFPRDPARPTQRRVGGGGLLTGDRRGRVLYRDADRPPHGPAPRRGPKPRHPDRPAAAGGGKSSAPERGPGVLPLGEPGLHLPAPPRPAPGTPRPASASPQPPL